jgi:hypothetical protein
LSYGLIGRASQAQAVLDPAEKKAAIEALCQNLEREYIFPEITEKYVRMLKDNLTSGRYDRIAQPSEFDDAVTNDLMAIHRDLHLSVRYNPEPEAGHGRGGATGGGAHDNKFIVLTDNFMMSLPFARAVNPVTKTTWEEVGVEPDVKVSQDKALATAEVLACRKLAAREKAPGFKALNEWQAADCEAALNPPVLTAATLRSYVGTYGPRTISLERGVLFYSREGRPKRKMIPVGKDLFRVEGVESFRIRFVIEGNRVVAVEAVSPAGVIDPQSKER